MDQFFKLKKYLSAQWTRLRGTSPTTQQVETAEPDPLHECCRKTLILSKNNNNNEIHVGKRKIDEDTSRPVKRSRPHRLTLLEEQLLGEDTDEDAEYEEQRTSTFTSLSLPRSVEFELHLYDGETKSSLFDTKDERLQTDYQTMKTFLETVHVELPSGSRGHSANISGRFESRTKSVHTSTAISEPSTTGAQNASQVDLSLLGSPPGGANGHVEIPDVPVLVESPTIWCEIQVGEPVFARWEDKKYYSGCITKKGPFDTWTVHYEDDMDSVVSEKHLLPIKTLGIGIRAIYCPLDYYRPEEVVVIGHRLVATDGETEYVVVSDQRQMSCFRKNLAFKESVAKELRKEYEAQRTCSGPKGADIDSANIIAARRRRPAPAAPDPTPIAAD